MILTTKELIEKKKCFRCGDKIDYINTKYELNKKRRIYCQTCISEMEIINKLLNRRNERKIKKMYEFSESMNNKLDNLLKK